MSVSAEPRSDTARAVEAGRKPRTWGAWYVTEHRFRVMRSYTGTVIVAGIGSPLVYLYALGVGLATIVDANLGSGAVERPRRVHVTRDQHRAGVVGPAPEQVQQAVPLRRVAVPLVVPEYEGSAVGDVAPRQQGVDEPGSRHP